MEWAQEPLAWVQVAEWPAAERVAEEWRWHLASSPMFLRVVVSMAVSTEKESEDRLSLERRESRALHGWEAALLAFGQ